MSIAHHLVDPNYPMNKLGIDPSTAIGATLLALRLRRYWLDRNLDVPSEIYVVQSRADRGGPAHCRTVYGARIDFKAARAVDANRRMQLILSIEDEAAVYA